MSEIVEEGTAEWAVSVARCENWKTQFVHEVMGPVMCVGGTTFELWHARLSRVKVAPWLPGFAIASGGLSTLSDFPLKARKVIEETTLLRAAAMGEISFTQDRRDDHIRERVLAFIREEPRTRTQITRRFQAANRRGKLEQVLAELDESKAISRVTTSSGKGRRKTTFTAS